MSLSHSTIENFCGVLMAILLGNSVSPENIQGSLFVSKHCALAVKLEIAATAKFSAPLVQVVVHQWDQHLMLELVIEYQVYAKRSLPGTCWME